MMQQVLNQRTSVRATENSEKLFSGIWIRWSALRGEERLICANIVLLPVWWLAGITSYMLLFLLLGILFYDWRRYGKLRLKQPSWVVIALSAYHGYVYLDEWLLFLNAYPFVDNYVPNLGNLVKATIQFFVLPILVWYIQSNKVKVRSEVIAWACSVSVVQMLLMWLCFNSIPWAFDTPPRTLYAFLTGKTPNYIPGGEEALGAGNYLLVKDEEAGRFRFFFDHYQSCAAFLGFTGLLALDLKKRLWSVLLLVACCFLLTTVAARSVWIAFTLAVVIRYVYSHAKQASLLFALIALISFVTLSLPPVTDLILNSFQETKQGLADARAGSTEARSIVYRETIKRIPDRPIFGHKVEGERILVGSTTNLWGGTVPPIGSHSFILGKLLYQKGLVGTSIFATFWILLFVWLYKTRISRPLCCLFAPFMLTIMSSFTVMQSMMTVTTLLCMVMHKPIKNSFSTRRINSHT